RARINRGTFYIHYKGKQDLLNQLEENVYANIIKLFHENGTISSATSYEDLNEQFFQKFSAYIYGERDFILAMVLGNGDPMFYQDRKSTRLNSSHVSISYAVFCLKKKNRHSRRDIQNT